MADGRRRKKRAPLDSQFISNELVDQETDLIDFNNRSNPYATRADVTAESVDIGLIANVPVRTRGRLRSEAEDVAAKKPPVSEFGRRATQQIDNNQVEFPNGLNRNKTQAPFVEDPKPPKHVKKNKELDLLGGEDMFEGLTSNINQQQKTAFVRRKTPGQRKSEMFKAIAGI